MSKSVTYLNRSLLCFFALVLFSNVTFGYAVDIHQCQGEFYSVAFFGNKASCDKMTDTAQGSEVLSCCDQKKPLQGFHFSSKSCCSNDHFVQDDVLEPTTNFNFSPAPLDVAIITDVQWESAIVHAVAVEFGNKIPPPPLLPYAHLAENLQVFLI